MTLVGRGGTKSKWGFHRRGGLNDVVHRYLVLMDAGRNDSWERMYGLEMTADMRAGFCCWGR